MPYLNPKDKADIKKESVGSFLPATCMLCGYHSLSSNDMIEHMTAVHNRITTKCYACLNCAFAATTPSKLLHHVKYVHDKLRKCNTCGFEGNLNEYNKHVKEKHIENQKACKFCEFSTFTPTYMKQHIHSIHDQVYGEACDQCDYKSTRKSLLLEHKVYAHEKHKHEKCPFCSYRINRSKDLVNHIKRVHHKEPYNVKRISCTKCDYSATKPQMVKKHLYLKHYELHVCEWCTFASKEKDELRKHERDMHSDRINQCSLCSFSTSRLNEFKHHLKSVHEKRRDEVCSKCGKRFSSETSLIRHRKEVHEFVYNQFCDACDFSCATKRKLYDHKRSVHIKSYKPCKVKKISCAECNYSASKPRIVKKHFYLKHYGLHVCEWCTFTSKDMVELKEHEKAMHSERINQCYQCSYSTSRLCQLQKHIKAVHEKTYNVVCLGEVESKEILNDDDADQTENDPRLHPREKEDASVIIYECDENGNVLGEMKHEIEDPLSAWKGF